MSDFSVEFRFPKGCPSCDSHRMKVSQAKNPTDLVICASCNTEVCEWSTAEDILDNAPRSEDEKLIEDVVNSNKPQ